MKSMFSFLSLILTTLCFSITLQAFENECPMVDQVITNDEGVYLHVDDFWIRSEGLLASNEGLFVLVEGNWLSLVDASMIEDMRRNSWKCRKCGRYNLEGINTCPYCGAPRK